MTDRQKQTCVLIASIPQELILVMVVVVMILVRR